MPKDVSESMAVNSHGSSVNQLEHESAFTTCPAVSREVVRCCHCHLVQFRTVSNFCRRCAQVLPHAHNDLAPGDREPLTPKAGPVISGKNAPTSSKLSQDFAIGPRLKELRQARNLTQAQIARKARVPRTYVSRIEHCHLVPGLLVVRRLADALEVGVLELFSDQLCRIENLAVSNAEYWNSFVMYFRQLRPVQQRTVLREIRAMLRQRLLQQRLTEYQAIGRVASISRAFTVPGLA